MKTFQKFKDDYAYSYHHYKANLDEWQTGSIEVFLRNILPAEAYNEMDPPGIVHLFGLDNRIVKIDGQDIPPILATLNFERERLFRALPFHLVFWSQPYSQVRTQRCAPDFWDWLTYKFFFPGDPEKDLQPDQHMDWASKNHNQVKSERSHEIARLLDLLENTSGERVRDKITLLNALGKAFYEWPDFHRAIKYYLEVLEWRDQLTEDEQAYYLYRIAKIYRELGQQQEADQFLMESESFLDGQEGPTDLKAKILLLKGDLAQDRGKIRLAESVFMELQALAQAGLSQQEGSQDWKYWVSIGYERMGSILKEQGQYESALNYFQKETALFEELYETNPHSESLKNGLAVSYERMGDILKEQGQYESALDYFQKETALFEELYETNPHSESLKNGLAISYSKMGNILKEQGQYESALDYFQKYLKVREELYETNPHSESLKNGLAVSYERMGSILKEQGQYESALDYFQKYLKVREELYETNPHSVGIKNGLAYSYYYSGLVSKELGHLSKSLNLFEKAYAIWDDLADLTQLEKYKVRSEKARKELEPKD